MVSTILIVFFSLIGLITLHELGHFVLARKFGVRVEEFGIFLPPRIWGKKIGETIYSINWIPAGAFVRLYGEDREDESVSAVQAPKDAVSFGSKPIWQRMLIIAAGVISFWIISIILMIWVALNGSITQIEDTEPADAAQVLIISVASNSPAESAGLAMGDIVKNLTLKNDAAQKIVIDKVGQIQDFAAAHKGQEIVMDIQRGGQESQVTLTPRVDPPAGEGAMGVSLARVAQKTYTWDKAIVRGFTSTWDMTLSVFDGWGQMIGQLVSKQGLPPGTQLVGPVGIMEMMAKQVEMGASYYIRFVAMISVYLAVFNALPIPALDGGRLMFLAIEAIRRKPVSQRIEQNLTMFFFVALMLFAIIVTVQDVRRLF